MTFRRNKETASIVRWFYAALIVAVSLGAAAVGIASWMDFAFGAALASLTWAALTSPCKWTTDKKEGPGDDVPVR